MHTETTLHHFDNCTTCLGRALRKFHSATCSKFDTHDLPRETAARTRRRGAKAAKGKGKANVAPQAASKHRKFNMSTYKLHALGDYVKSIWLYGTTDNYSTQVVSSRLFVSHSKKSD